MFHGFAGGEPPRQSQWKHRVRLEASPRRLNLIWALTALDSAQTSCETAGHDNTIYHPCGSCGP